MKQRAALLGAARYIKIGIDGANHMIGRLTRRTVRYITIHAP